MGFADPTYIAQAGAAYVSGNLAGAQYAVTAGDISEDDARAAWGLDDNAVAKLHGQGIDFTRRSKLNDAGIGGYFASPVGTGTPQIAPAPPPGPFVIGGSSPKALGTAPGAAALGALAAGTAKSAAPATATAVAASPHTVSPVFIVAAGLAAMVYFGVIG